MLVTVCFFTYCKAGNDPVSASDPDNMVEVEADVTLSLDCVESRKTKLDCISSTKEITNTIKDANLPIYTVRRKEPKDDPLTVTLTWIVGSSDGSGFGSASMRTVKERAGLGTEILSIIDPLYDSTSNVGGYTTSAAVRTSIGLCHSYVGHNVGALAEAP